MATAPQPLDNTFFAQEAIQNDFLPEAKRQTEDNENAYNNAVATAKMSGGNAPAGYYTVSVDQDLVVRLYTGEDTTPEDWNKIFVKTFFVPPQPPAPPKPVGYPVGPPIGVNNEYFALAGGGYSNGEKFTDSRGTFTKHVVVGPFGSWSWWTLDQ